MIPTHIIPFVQFGLLWDRPNQCGTIVNTTYKEERDELWYIHNAIDYRLCRVTIDYKEFYIEVLKGKCFKIYTELVLIYRAYKVWLSK